jgi:CHAT domain-containing protein
MGVWRWLVAAVSGLVLAVAGQGAAPPARKLTPVERAQRLKERARLHALAAKQAQAGRLGEAIATWKKKIAVERELFRVAHEELAGSLEALASLEEHRGGFAEGQRALGEVVAIRTRLYGRSHWRVTDARLALRGLVLRAEMSPAQRKQWAQAYALSARVVALYGRGRAREAVRLARQARDQYKAALGEKHPAYATSLNNLAMLYRAMGDYARARPLYEQARDLHKAALGEKHPLYALSLNNLAALYQDMGDYARARPLYEQARDLRKAALDERHPDYALSVNNLAALYRATGDYARARPLYEQARDLYKAALGQKHPLYALSLNNLAELYQAMGDYARARPLYEQARDLHKAALGQKHPRYATSLHNLAGLYRAMGDYARARPLYEQARDLHKAALGEKHPLYASSLNNLAGLYRDMGDYARARPLYEQARDLCKAALGEKHPLYADSLNNLASLHALEGKKGQALATATAALGIHQAHLENTFSTLSARQRLGLLASLRFSLDLRLSLAARDPAGRRYRAVLGWKGVTAARDAEERLAGDRPALRPLIRRLREARAGLARLSANPPSPAGLTDWQKRFADLERRKDDLEAQLARASARFRTLRQRRTLTAAQVAKALPPRTALIDFLVYTHWQPSRTRKGIFEVEERLLAFVLRAGKDEPVCVPLGGAAALDRLVRAWRRPLTAERPTQPDPALAAALRRRLWLPLQKHLAGARAVLIAPDGFLCGLPFAALPGKGAGTYLLEELSIGYVSSGRHLLELADEQEKSGTGLLGVGDLAYGKAPGRRELDAFRGRFLPWEGLPGTRAELERLAALFRAAFLRGRAPRLLRGTKGDKAALLSALPPGAEGRRWRWLHLATHGFFEPPRSAVPLPALAGWAAGLGAAPGWAGALQALTALHAADDPEARDRSRRSFDLSGQHGRTFERNPLLLCGLVLAGANESPEGLLSAEEVAGLDLRGCELAVLSACDTGLGKVAGGQGVLGLQRAFQAAGARATLTSLWSVSDAATSVLMEEFYKNLWQKKLTKLEALRQAQLTVLKGPKLVEARHALLLAELKKLYPKGKAVPPRGPAKVAVVQPGGKGKPGAKAARTNPAYWAAFVLSGAGR